MSTKTNVLSWLVMVAALSAGCATVPLSTPQEDLRVKALSPPPDAALVYLYRNENFGGAVKMPVLMDNVYSGETGAKTYMVWQVAPGPHVLLSKTENDATLDLVAEPAHKYFVWQEVKMGLLSARSKLHAVTDDEGTKALSACKLVQMPAAGH